MFKRSYILAIALITTLASFSQQSISLKEAALIKYRAEQLVIRELKDRMILISSNDVDELQLKKLITDSYSQGLNRIFDSSASIIEDDIDPTHNYTTPKVEIFASKYLSDLDLLYTKSPNASIVFTLERISNVKRYNKNTYVKVYYTSFFRNNNRTVEKAYG